MSDEDKVPVSFKVPKYIAEMLAKTDRLSWANSELVEYILKSTADKRLKNQIDASKEVLMELIDSQNLKVEEILKPVREWYNKDHHRMMPESRCDKVCLINNMADAIKETLELTDKDKATIKERGKAKK